MLREIATLLTTPAMAPRNPEGISPQAGQNPIDLLILMMARHHAAGDQGICSMKGFPLPTDSNRDAVTQERRGLCLDHTESDSVNRQRVEVWLHRRIPSYVRTAELEPGSQGENRDAEIKRDRDRNPFVGFRIRHFITLRGIVTQS